MSQVITSLYPGVCVFKAYTGAQDALLINTGVTLPLSTIYKLYEKYVKEKHDYTNKTSLTESIGE